MKYSKILEEFDNFFNIKNINFDINIIYVKVFL